MSNGRMEKSLDEPIVRHMRSDFMALDVGHTVGQALATIRENPSQGRIIYFYVVDQQSRLKGVVPTRRLLLSPLDTPVANIMVREIVAVPQTATVLEACEYFILHRLLAFPVVDEHRRILGIVDVELYTTELDDLDRSARSDDVFQLIGVHLAEPQQTSSLAAFRGRFPWLMANIAGGIMAAFMVGIFEAELQQVVALALFIPVVLAISESVGIQSLTLALQVLHGRKPTIPVMLGKLRAEVVTGLFLGIASATIVGVIALLWLRQFLVALALLGGIAGGVAFAAVIGVAMPNVLRLLRCDPQVAAGPLALAISDIGTLLIYFTIARWLL